MKIIDNHYPQHKFWHEFFLNLVLIILADIPVKSGLDFRPYSGMDISGPADEFFCPFKHSSLDRFMVKSVTEITV